MSLKLTDLLSLTMRSLLSNPLRSSLTLLGVFMGVTAVSATLQVGNISRAVIANRLAEREAPQVTIFPQWVPGPRDRIRLKTQDLEFLRQRLRTAQAISGVDWARSQSVVFQDREAYPSVNIVTLEYLETSGQKLAAGRFFSPADFENYRPVVIVDEALSQNLFRQQDPVGERIYVARQPYTVVGVMPTLVTEDEGPENGRILLPLSFYSALTGSNDIGSVRLRPHRIENLEQLGETAEQLLMRRYPGQRFFVWNNVEDILEQQQILELTARGLAAVGAISLVVGGIGIANIMIAAVAERTSEIGLRRAIGATRQEIVLQFLLEATLLSLVGGVGAIATVHSITSLVANQFELPYEFDAQIAALSLGSALAVGIGASLAPAIRAGQIDPIRALRSE